MKNINKNVWITAALGMFAFSVYAIDIVPTSASVARKMAVRNASVKPAEAAPADFLKAYNVPVKMEVSSLPKAVKSAVMTKYVAYAIAEAYRENDGTFRLILKNGDSKIMSYYSESGKYLKQEIMKTVQMVALS